MTAADLIKACAAFEAEHGIADLLEQLNDIVIARAQAAGIKTEYEVPDGYEEVDVGAADVFTIH